jgi:excisionase family DNA binding protein
VTTPVTPTRNGHANTRERNTIPRYLSVPEAAEYLNTSVRFVRRLVAERRVAFHKLGKHIRFAVDDLDNYLAAGRIEPISVSDVWRSMKGVA